MSRRHTSSERGRYGRTVVGATSAVGAFLAFGMAPLATAPVAQADEFDVILDPIIDSLSSIDPTLGADLSTLVGSFDPTFAGDSATSVDSVLDAAGAGASAAASVDYSQLFDQWVYTPDSHRS